MDRLSRRGAVVAAAAVALTACGGGQRRPDASAGASGTRSPQQPPTTASGPPALPDVTAWAPDPSDVEPGCKMSAVRRIERAGNTDDTALQVIDAQYGGLLTDRASVLVVSRSWTRTRGRIVPGGHTYDVRLSRSAAGWRVTAVHPSRPGPPASRLSPAARHVLSDRRIHLPPAAAADVRSGRVHDSVLETMLALGATYLVSVSVIRSGHPHDVFGTDRPSDHPQGRAFDTWAIDGHPVVSRRTPRSLVVDYMHAVAAAGSYNVGGPYVLGPAPQWFSDPTHHDHVHAGFRT